jgi:hypothetical protein
MSKEECVARDVPMCLVHDASDNMMHEVSKQTIEKSIEDGVVTASVTTIINGKVENKFLKERC